jgi:hypothetical protein
MFIYKSLLPTFYTKFVLFQYVYQSHISTLVYFLHAKVHLHF